MSQRKNKKQILFKGDSVSQLSSYCVTVSFPIVSALYQPNRSIQGLFLYILDLAIKHTPLLPPLGWSLFLLWEIFSEHPINYFLFGALGVQVERVGVTAGIYRAETSNVKYPVKYEMKSQTTKKRPKTPSTFLLRKTALKFLSPSIGLLIGL